MRNWFITFLVPAWMAASLFASNPTPERIRPWLIVKPGTSKLVSKIKGTTKIFNISVESPENGLWLKKDFENERYLCLSFICDSDSDILFILDKSRNKEVRLGKHFQYYSLNGLIAPDFLLIAQEEISSEGDENYGFVVLRLSDLKSIRVGKDAFDYQLRVEGEYIVGTKTVMNGIYYDQVPYRVSTRKLLSQFK